MLSEKIRKMAFNLRNIRANKTTGLFYPHNPSLLFKERGTHLPFVFLILAFSVINLYWISASKFAITVEETVFLAEADHLYANHLYGSQVYLESFLSDGYSPVPKLIVFFVYMLFGIQGKGLYLFNLAMFIASLIFVYFSAIQLSGKKDAVIAVLFIISLPATVIFIRSLYEQIFLLLFFSFSFYLLLKTRSFQDRKYSLLFGASLGVFAQTRVTSLPYIFAMVLLWAYIIVEKTAGSGTAWPRINPYKPAVLSFLVFSLIYISVSQISQRMSAATYFFFFIGTYAFLSKLRWSARPAGPESRSLHRNRVWPGNKILNNYLDSISLFLILSITWYWRNAAPIAGRYFSESSIGHLDAGTVLGNLGYYLLVFLKAHAGLLIFLLVAIFVLYSFALNTEKAKKARILGFFLILIPYIILSFIPAKRYTVSYLLALPLALFITIISSGMNKASKYLFIAILAASAFYYSCPSLMHGGISVLSPQWTYDSGPYAIDNRAFPVFSKDNSLFNDTLFSGELKSKVYTGFWPGKYSSRIRESGIENPRILLLAEDPMFTKNVFAHYLLQEGIIAEINGFQDISLEGTSQDYYNSADFSDYDFIIFPDVLFEIDNDPDIQLKKDFLEGLWHYLALNGFSKKGEGTLLIYGYNYPIRLYMK